MSSPNEKLQEMMDAVGKALEEEEGIPAATRGRLWKAHQDTRTMLRERVVLVLTAQEAAEVLEALDPEDAQDGYQRRARRRIRGLILSSGMVDSSDLLVD